MIGARRFVWVLAVASLFLTVPVASGQLASDVPSDSVAIGRLRGLVAAINSGSSAAIRSYLESAHVLPEPPGALLNRSVAFFSSIYDRSRGFEVRDLQAVSSTEAVALLKSNLTGLWEPIAVRIESRPPHRIVEVGSPSRPLPVPPSDAVAVRTDAERIQSLDHFISRLAGADVFSGVVLLAKGDSVLFLRAYGSADREGGAPVQTNTRFALGSIAKMFTAVAVAQLAEQGKLSFDDPVSKYVPEFRNREALAKVRLKHLLSHTSGINDYLRVCERVRGACITDPHTLDDYLKLVNLAQADTLLSEPGTRWRYNNAGFVLLARVVELASGQRYQDYVREHIFQPAGMTRTDFPEPRPVAGWSAARYEKEFTEGGVRFRLDTSGAGGIGDGGAYGTAEDLLRFVSAFRGGRLVARDYVRLLASPKPELASPEYGYGVSLDPAEGIFGHGGTWAGASNSLDVFPHAGYTAVVLSNYSYARTLPRERIWAVVPNP